MIDQLASGQTLRRCGERAVLVELDALDQVLALGARLRSAVADREPGFDRVVEVVPAARTVLVVLDDAADHQELDRLRRALDGVDVVEAAGDRTGQADVRIPVRYDGPDLAEVSDLTGLSTAEVVAAHQETPWRVAFCGFAPGFAYLVGGDPRLRVPRRATPRTSVPAGSVGLAAEFSAVYPRSSPGGWQLIGRTELPIWDPAREPPALLSPGTEVRFVDADSDEVAERLRS
jgi:KipI family sensor histidine kinase inhibitor